MKPRSIVPLVATAGAIAVLALASLAFHVDAIMGSTISDRTTDGFWRVHYAVVVNAACVLMSALVLWACLKWRPASIRRTALVWLVAMVVFWLGHQFIYVSQFSTSRFSFSLVVPIWLTYLWFRSVPNKRVESLPSVARTALLAGRCASAPRPSRKAAAHAKR